MDVHLSSYKRVCGKNFWLQKNCNFLLSEARVAIFLFKLKAAYNSPLIIWFGVIKSNYIWWDKTQSYVYAPLPLPLITPRFENGNHTESFKGIVYKWKEYSDVFFSISSRVLLTRVWSNAILLEHIWQWRSKNIIFMSSGSAVLS